MNLTPRERFMNALAGYPVDRTPVASPTSIVTAELEDLVGAHFPEAHHDPAAMAALALAGHTDCGYDVVFPVYGGGTHEAAALGVPVRWGDRSNLPAIAGHIWDHPDQIAVPDDFLDCPTVKVVIDATRRLRRELGDEVAIIGKIYGPWSLAYHTFGLQNFLKDTIRDPGKVRAILARLKEVSVIFGRAQVEAGADALTLGDHITADLIRPDAYPDFLLDIHREMGREIPAPLIFHCCGKTLDRIDYFNENGLSSFHFDSENDAFEMKARAKMVLIGNVNAPRTLLEGTKAEVRAEVFYALDAGIDIIAPECAVPLSSKLENIVAVRESVDAYFARR
jgi:[methyl-Co(III) methanol-specific corrinoid protein]:coenzyme M methyltransferase